MADTTEHKERLEKLEGAIKYVDGLVPEVKDIPEIKRSIQEVRKELEELKGKIGETGYDDLKEPVQQRLSNLREDIITAKDHLAKLSLVEKQLDMSTNVLKAPYIQTRVTRIKTIISDIRTDITLYESRKDEVQNLLAEIQNLQPQFAQLEKLGKLEDFITNLRPEVSSDKRILPFVKKLSDGITLVRSNIENGGHDIDGLNDVVSELNVLLEQINLLSVRRDSLVQNEQSAKMILNKLNPAEIANLGEKLGLDEVNKNTVAKSLAQMMLEGDGLSAEAILKFYEGSKNRKNKIATEEDIQSWIAEIQSQDTTDKVKGTKVTGSIPEDMKDALMDSLRGPNTLKMMRVASEMYQRELNDYLAGVDKNISLNELGFDGKDTGLLWFDRDAGENLDLSDQEKKLIFLEGYTSTLARVLQNPDAIEELAKEGEGFGWWWLAIIAGGMLAILSGTTILAAIEKIHSNTVTGKVIGFGLKWTIGKPLSAAKHALTEVFTINKSNYEGMMDPEHGPLHGESRLYILANIQLIHARMNLSEGQTLPFEGDTYGPLSHKEGLKRIRALQSAVGSAKREFLKKDSNPTEKKATSRNRFGYIETDISNTTASKDCRINEALARYIQNLSRSSAQDFGILRPNTHYLEQNVSDHLASLGIRLLETGPLTSLGYFVGGVPGALVGLVGSPGIRRTIIGNIPRLWQNRLSGFYVDSQHTRRITALSGLDDIQKMNKRIGEAITADDKINKLTCSLADINAGVDFLKQFVDASAENSSSNPDIYSEEEAYNKIRGILEQRGYGMTRLELRLNVIRSIYLLRSNSGTIPATQVDDFITSITENRFSHFDSDSIDALYKKIIVNKDHKIPKNELSLLTLQIQALYEGHGITATSLEYDFDTTAELFPGLDPYLNRVSVAQMDQIMQEALSSMQSRNDRVAATDRMTREDFAEDVVRRLGNENPPIGYPLHDRFDDLWKGDILRREGLDPIVKQIHEGDIATVDELQINFLRTVSKPDIASLSREESEGWTILNDKFTTFIYAQEAKIKGSKITDIFVSASDKATAKTEFIRIFGEKSMRCVALYEIAHDAYSVEAGTWQMNTKKFEENFETRWNTWIIDRISIIKSEFDGDPLFEHSHDIRENLRKLMAKCTPEQKREMAEHIRVRLESIAQETDENIVPRSNRHKALVLLEDSTLVLEHIPPVAQEALKNLIKKQKEVLKKLDDADEKAKKEAEIAKEVQEIKDDILVDPLTDGLEERIEETLDKCGTDKDLRKKFAKDLAVHFRNQLMITGGLTDPTLTGSRKKALILLTSRHITDNIGTTDNETLKRFIEQNTRSLETQGLDAKIQPLKEAIDRGALENTVEIALNSLIGELKGDSREMTDRRVDLIKHYRGALQALLSDPNITDENCEEIIGHLESSLVMQNLPRPEQGELRKFVGSQKEKLMQKHINVLKDEIKRQPFNVENKISSILTNSQYSETQRDEIVRAYMTELKNIAQNDALPSDTRKTALTALRGPIIATRLGLVEKTELDTFVKNQETALDALERMTKKRKENAEKLMKTIADTLNGKTTPEDQKTALKSLIEGKTLTLGQKNIIREFFPEESEVAPTEEMIQGCMHRLIYATQEVRTGDSLVEAHNTLMADQQLLVSMNAQLRALHIAEIEVQISDNVNISK